MAIVLSTSDFDNGKYKISSASSNLNTNVASLQESISNYEKPAIYALLGATQGATYITWLQTPNTNAEFTYIKNAFADDIYGVSLGLKEYLKAYIFYEHIKNSIVMSQLGAVTPKAETSNQQTPAQQLRFAENKFNDALNTIEAIQRYCMANRTAFPDFKGQRITVKAGGIL